MNRRYLEQRLLILGWRLLRHGGSHDIWSRGARTLPVPRHSDINELTARAILREAHKE